MTENLRGASVAITGAANGIGLAAAEQFAAAGARVAIGDIDEAAAIAAAARIGDAAIGVGFDVSDRAGFEHLAQLEADLTAELDSSG